jgi:hypothetical protein
MAEDQNPVGSSAMASLRRAVAIVGPLDKKDLAAISSEMETLQDTTRSRWGVSYDRHFSSLVGKRPTKRDRKEDLDKYIKDRYPQGKGYTDKMYKMFFLRWWYRLRRIFRQENTSASLVVRSSLESLTTFKLLTNVVLANTRRLVALSSGQDQSQEDLQPEEFDTEQSSTTDDLWRQIRPSPSTDQSQRQTDTNVQRSTRRVQPTGTVESEAEYTAQIAKHSQIVEEARNSITSHKDSVGKALSKADARTFQLVVNSSKAMNDLAKAYDRAAVKARGALAPGSYTACKAFSVLLAAITQIVLDSAPKNAEERKMETRRQTDLDRFLKVTDAPNQEDDPSQEEGEQLPLAASSRKD